MPKILYSFSEGQIVHLADYHRTDQRKSKILGMLSQGSERDHQNPTPEPQPQPHPRDPVSHTSPCCTVSIENRIPRRKNQYWFSPWKQGYGKWCGGVTVSRCEDMGTLGGWGKCTCGARDGDLATELWPVWEDRLNKALFDWVVFQGSWVRRMCSSEFKTKFCIERF